MAYVGISGFPFFSAQTAVPPVAHRSSTAVWLSRSPPRRGGLAHSQSTTRGRAMISIISYNVGIQRSMWQKHFTEWTKPGRFRTEKVIDILAQHEPDLMCLQEMGMHEEGLPPRRGHRHLQARRSSHESTARRTSRGY